MSNAKTCYVPHCSTLRKELVFKFPSNKKRGLVWLTKIHKREIDLDDLACMQYRQSAVFICHKHFTEDSMKLTGTEHHDLKITQYPA